MTVADSDVLIDVLRGRSPAAERMARELQAGSVPTTNGDVVEEQTMRDVVLSLMLVLMLATVGAAQDLPDVEQFGPQVGDVVPAFTLTAQNGQTQTLQSIMGPNGAMLVFNRSADW